MIFPMEWYLLFLVSIPQVYLGLLLGLTIFNLKINYKQLLLIAIFGGGITFAVRFIPMIFGLPSIIDLVALSVLVAFIGKIKLSHSFCATMAAVMIMAIVECCIIPICFNVTGVTLKVLQEQQIYIFWFFIPEALFMTTLYLFIRLKHFKMWDLNKLEVGK